jgi:hypothetical protein
MEQSTNPIDNLDPNTEFDVFIDDKIINVPMSGFFVKRLQLLGDYVVSTKSPEEIIAIYDKMAEGKELTDTFEINLETFITLMNQIDTSGKEQGATKKMKVSEIKDSIQDTSKLSS